MVAVIALMSSLLWGTSDFLGGIVSRRISSFVVVAMSQLAGLIFALVLAISFRSWQSPLAYMPWAVLASLSGAGGLIIFYRALATGTMGVVAPISATAGVIPVAVGLATGDALSVVAIFGAIGIGLGVMLASGPELRHGAGWQPLAMAGSAAVLFGIALVAIAQGSQTSPIMTMLGMRVVSVVLIGSYVMWLWRRGKVQLNGHIRLVLVVALCGVLDVGANLAFGYASAAGELALVSILGSLYPLVTALLAASFLHERLARIQYVGVVLALAGLGLVLTA